LTISWPGNPHSYGCNDALLAKIQENGWLPPEKIKIQASATLEAINKRHPKARYLNRLRFVLQCGFQADYLSAITQFGMNPKWDFNRTVREYLE
jgi:hypothetical protein